MKACINGSRLAYDDIGYGPAVILIHSFPLSRRMWQSQIEALSGEGFRVIAPDLRGFGESKSHHAQFDPAALADDICGLMSYLGIGRAVMVGISTACGLLIDMLERYPQRVAAICFLSPDIRRDDANDQADRFNLAKLVREGHRKHAIDNLCQHLLDGPPTPARKRLSGHLRSWMQTADTPALLGTLEGQPRRLNVSVDGGSRPVPSMVLAGARDRRVQGIKPSGMFDGSQQVIVDAGHLVNLEAPDEVNGHLLGFVKKLHSIKLQHHRLQRVA